MINSVIENSLIQFQRILALLIKRSSETAFFPIISFYKSQLETQINLAIRDIEDQKMSDENLLLISNSIDEFLKKTLDVEINLLKKKNKSLYLEYNKYRTGNNISISDLPEYSGKAITGITQILNLPYLSSRSFLIKNTGSNALSFYLSENFKNPDGITVTLNPNDTILRSSGIMNANAKSNKLYVINKEKTIGYCKIWIL